MRRGLEVNDVVVVPSGKRAVIVVRSGNGWVECAYLDAAGKADLADRVDVRESLVRRIERGLVPPPVRINNVRAG